jgi:DNA-binding IclR family transcriptional regulator
LEATVAVQALDRAVLILNAFTVDRAEVGVSEIARETGLTKTTTHRLLSALVEYDIVERTGDGSVYRLGAQILRWAGVAQAHVSLGQLAKSAMFALRDQVGETVGLHVLDGSRHRQVIAQVESRHEIRRTYTEIGQPIPIHLGAPGKLLLAYQDRSVQDEVLASVLPSATPETKINPDELREELARIREQGYSLSIQERIAGVASMSVPVRDHTDQVHTAISVSGPAQRLTPERLVAAVPAAQQAAERLSELLGAPRKQTP